MKIFLIGFMGSVKTYWGKIWAKQYGLSFFDLDEVIEKEQGKTVAAIFEKEGEAYFRKVEAIALHTFLDEQDCIIACGGGTACFDDNMQWMNDNGITVYLSATAQHIFNRVIEEKDKRPLMKKLNDAELLFFIEQTLKALEPFYNQAKWILAGDKINASSLSDFNIKI